MRILSILLAIGFLFGESRLIDRWHTYEEVRDQLLAWDEEFGSSTSSVPPWYNDSGIIYHLETIGHSSLDSLPFWGVRLSYNADVKEDEPRILILGQCHAEEIFGVESAMKMIEMFLYPIQELQNYILYMAPLLESAEIWIVPTYNPEGLQVVHGFDDDGVWIQDESYRKNKRDINLNGLFDFEIGIGNDSDGVDLNRNYDFNWIFGDAEWVVDPGGTDYISNYDYYRGPGPASEPEIQAMMAFAKEQQFTTSIAYHSSRSGNVSEKVIYSWEWIEGGKYSPDHTVIFPIGETIAGLIPKESGSGTYTPVTSKSRKGNAHDWFYTQTGCIQFLIEQGTSNLQPNDPEIIDDTVIRNLAGAFYMMNRTIGFGQYQLGAESYQVTGLVTDIDTGLPVAGAQVHIPELSGPMLEPRLTNEFGRYHRLLTYGTYTIDVSARGYEHNSVSVTPSSSAVSHRDVQLVPLAQHMLTVNIDPAYGEDSAAMVVADEYGSDTLTVTNSIQLELWENEYDIYFIDEGLFPKMHHVVLTEDHTLDIDLKWAGVLWSESFENLSDWTADGPWLTDWDILSSQDNLVYEDGADVQLTYSGSDLTDAGYQQYALVLDWQYELEWDFDTLGISVSAGGAQQDHTWMGHNWEFHQDFRPVELSDQPAEISIWIHPDETLGYRGVDIEQMMIVFEPDGECVFGDYNQDGSVDVSDVVTLLNDILEYMPITGSRFCAAEGTGDGRIDILDLVYLVAVILEL